jgi:chemotaxis response regulator CheB
LVWVELAVFVVSSLSSDERRSRPDVVAVAASAGGVSAISTVLRALPAELPAAVVVALQGPSS